MEASPQVPIDEGSYYLELASAYDKSDEHSLAIYYYRLAASAFVSQLRNRPQSQEIKIAMQENADNTIMRAEILKGALERVTKSQVTGLKKHVPAKEKSLIAEVVQCAEHYKKLGEAYFKEVVEKQRLWLLASACVAHVIEIEIKGRILKTMPEGELKSHMKAEIGKALLLCEGYKKQVRDDPDKDEKSWFKSKSYTDDERRIMLVGEYLGSIKALLWFDSLGVFNIFESQIYEDPDGVLPLSPGQQSRFGSWKHLHQICALDPRSIAPQLIASQPNAYEIQQSLAGDSSIFASLSALAHYDYKFQSKRVAKGMINSLIYPQDSEGNSIFNPTGLYKVKLFLNGIWRQIEIDDFFPVDKSGYPLSLSSTTPANSWVQILEKAFLKAKGLGYHYVSDPAGELFALTGWMPERVFLKNANTEEVWSRLRNGVGKGEILACLMTGKVEDERETGLRSHGSYAILEAMEIKGIQLLMIANSWKDSSWKLAFSSEDQVSWSEELKTAVQYSAFASLLESGRIFWIDFPSVCRYFDSLHIALNHSLLPYKRSVWGTYRANPEGRSDLNSITHCPQYSIQFFPGAGDTLPEVTFWVCLDKHRGQGEASDGDALLGLTAFESTALKPTLFDEQPVGKLSQKMSNKAQTLYKFSFDKTRLNSVANFINIVVRANHVFKDVNYTLHCLSTANFTLTLLTHAYKEKVEIPISLNERNSGGAPDSPVFYCNPQYVIKCASEKGKKVENVPIRISYESVKDNAFTCVILTKPLCNRRILYLTSDIQVACSDTPLKYRPQFNCIETIIPQNEFRTVIFSNYHSQMTGDYIMTFESPLPLTIEPIPPENAPLAIYEIKGAWKGSNAGGKAGNPSYFMNPIYCFKLDTPSDFQARIRVLEEEQIPGQAPVTDHTKFKYLPNVAIFRLQYKYPPAKGALVLGPIPPIVSSALGVYTNNFGALVTERRKLDAGTYLLVPSLSEIMQLGKFHIQVYVDKTSGFDFMLYAPN